jgi:hypothetical protein
MVLANFSSFFPFSLFQILLGNMAEKAFKNKRTKNNRAQTQFRITLKNSTFPDGAVSKDIVAEENQEKNRMVHSFFSLFLCQKKDLIFLIA